MTNYQLSVSKINVMHQFI